VNNISRLFLKRTKAGSLEEVDELQFTPSGIVGAVSRPPLRQVLITAASELSDLSLSAGDLLENIVIVLPGLHALPSGSVLKIGAAAVRLTFHCEPCRNVATKASTKKLLHRRGALGCFLNSGLMKTGDQVSISTKTLEAIPYNPGERIRWYLNKIHRPIAARDLLYEVGLPNGYARALPAIMRKLEIASGRITFKNQAEIRKSR
jgi:hypothetical protein